MFGSAILDVAIGMIFIYLLMALMVTALTELIAAWLKWRAQNLIRGIKNMLTDDGLAQKLYSHPIVKCLYKDAKGPSYIPSRTFTLALLDIISPTDPTGPRTITDIEQKLSQLPEGDLKKTLTVLLDEARHDLEKFEESVETWFNNSMERLSGWYKRKSQLVNVILAVVVAVAANADSISIAKSLSSDPALRASVAAEAQEFAKTHADDLVPPQTPPADSESAKADPEAAKKAAQERATQVKKQLDDYRQQIQKLGVPIGWTERKPGVEDPRNPPEDVGGWIKKILGLLLTAIAVSLGAPFWFDMLNKVINIRSAGKAPEEKQKEPKKTPTPPEAGETPKEAAEREDSDKK